MIEYPSAVAVKLGAAADSWANASTVFAAVYMPNNAAAGHRRAVRLQAANVEDDIDACHSVNASTSGLLVNHHTLLGARLRGGFALTSADRVEANPTRAERPL